MINEELSKQHKDAAALLETLKEALPGLAGFKSLSLFGSLAEGRADEYSDIDIKVTTDDLPKAKEQIIGLLEQISPIEFAWKINTHPDEWNHTIAFRDYGYYCRLDLGIVDASVEHPVFPDERVILEGDNQPTPLVITKETDGYIPQYDSVGHFLLGQFIGCLRYLKSRKRGRILSCYRFASAAADWRIMLRYTRLTGDTRLRYKLSTSHYLEMDRLMSTDDLEAVIASLHFSSLPAMDDSVLASMDGILEDCVHLAGTLGEEIPVEVFQRIRGFIVDELHSM